MRISVKSLLVVAFTTFLFSCDKEDKDLSGQHTLTFEFNLAEPDTRAVLENGEGTISGAVDVYRFAHATDGSRGGAFVDKHSMALTASGSAYTGELSDLTGSGQYVYYIVANPSKGAAALSGVTGSTTEVVFVEMATDTQATTTHIATPLLMSGRSAAAGVDGTVAVALKHPAVRFDIVNANSDLAVKTIHVENANLKTNIFLDAQNPLTGIPQGDMPVIDISGYNFATATDNMLKGAFYLYPTTIDTDTGTKIYVTANYKDSGDKTYYIKGPLTVNENTRYKLVATDINEDVDEGVSVNFTLSIADWDEGSSHDFEKN